MTKGSEGRIPLCLLYVDTWLCLWDTNLSSYSVSCSTCGHTPAPVHQTLQFKQLQTQNIEGPRAQLYVERVSLPVVLKHRDTYASPGGSRVLCILGVWQPPQDGNTNIQLDLPCAPGPGTSSAHVLESLHSSASLAFIF